MPCKQCGQDSYGEAAPIFVNTIHLQGHSMEQLRETQLTDPIVGPVLRAKEADNKPDPEERRSIPLEMRRLFQQWDQLLLKDGILWQIFEDEAGSSRHLQLVVPRSLQDDVRQELHAIVSGAHLGEGKTTERFCERFYWPGQWKDVQSWCRTRPTCTTRKTPAPKGRAPLGTIHAGYPMQIVAVNILGPLPKSDAGNSYILVAGDYFTWWMEAYPIPNQEAVTVAKTLIDHLFSRFSTPEQLHSDQGRQFESNLLAEVCQILGIRKTCTTPYNSQCDGLVERFKQTLLDMLAITTKDHPADWEDHIRKVCMAYNTSVQATTDYTPFYLMFGRQARIPADVRYGTDRPTDFTPAKYAAELRANLEEAF